MGQMSGLLIQDGEVLPEAAPLSIPKVIQKLAL